MPLKDDRLTIDITALTVADVEDFKALTGKDIEVYLDELQKGGMQGATLAGIFSPEFQALLWVVMRDDATRAQVWDDVNDLYAAMQRDIRTLRLNDFTGFEVVTPAPPAAAARAQRTTGAQKRAAKRAEQAVG